MVKTKRCKLDGMDVPEDELTYSEKLGWIHNIEPKHNLEGVFVERKSASSSKIRLPSDEPVSGTDPE